MSVILPRVVLQNCHNEYHFSYVFLHSHDALQWNRMIVMRSKITCDPSFNSLFKHQTKYQNSALPLLYVGKPPMTGGIPPKGPMVRKAFQYRDVVTECPFV